MMNKWISLGIAAIAIFGGGCTAPFTVDVGYVEGSDEGYAQALIAADAWNTACGATLVVVHRGEGDVSLREQEGITHNAYGETTLERPFLNAVGEKRPTSIWVMSGWREPVELAHEMGHALGLSHEDHGIMRPSVFRELLDPATDYKTLIPGAITADQCESALNR